MITQVNPHVDPSAKGRFGTLAEDDRVKRAAAALEANGISVLRATNKTDAKRRPSTASAAGSTRS